MDGSNVGRCFISPEEKVMHILSLITAQKNPWPFSQGFAFILT